MKSLTIANLLTLMICTSVVALLLVGFIGISMANKGTESIRKINEESLASIQLLTDARQIFMKIRATGIHAC